MIAFVRSLLFAVIFYVGTAMIVLSGLVAALFGRDALLCFVQLWARYHRFCSRWILGITSRLEGQVPKGALLVACKHESMFETVDLLLILDAPAIVLKRELMNIPVWGRLARIYGAIVVDRAAGAGAMRRMLKDGREAIAQGRAILLFPEGTRVRHGAKPPIRSGFAGLYKMLNLPVLPIACDSGRLCPRKGFIKRPGVITYRVGEIMPPGLDRKDAEARVHAAINLLNG
ncbi:MAG: 1-acyl-sn-glycerol-3-phosphate acyltransferase [Sphingomonas sanxanigenens]|uniref:1-acyl-sn-glycerol-3-phosphate acyltransferase n=1 Tax=Sphingomonas sanxanigenens TaxID=397260 RepID=A0A2W5ABV9_9SPHN|nr:MAG: 1-acyl-sn-glycerol-3-phosphate acyltransferase [Sphingomonas sanxanigenens]